MNMKGQVALVSGAGSEQGIGMAIARRLGLAGARVLVTASSARIEQRAAVESELTQAVHNLLVSVEAYPDLKSNTNFLELQRELTDTEDRIAAARRFYNANVRNYNTKIDSFPSNILAGMYHFEKATYFEVNDPAVRQAPGVNFGEISQRPAGSTGPQQLPTNTQQPPVQPPAATPQISTDPFAQENQNKGPFQG